MWVPLPGLVDHLNSALFHGICPAHFTSSLKLLSSPGPGLGTPLSSYLEVALYKFHRWIYILSVLQVPATSLSLCLSPLHHSVCLSDSPSLCPSSSHSLPSISLSQFLQNIIQIENKHMAIETGSYSIRKLLSEILNNWSIVIFQPFDSY